MSGFVANLFPHVSVEVQRAAAGAVDANAVVLLLVVKRRTGRPLAFGIAATRGHSTSLPVGRDSDGCRSC